MKEDSVEILFQSFLQEALVSSSGMGRNVHSLMLSWIQFLLTMASPMLQVGDVEKFPQALSFKGLDPFFHSQQAGSMFSQPQRRMEATRDL